MKLFRLLFICFILLIGVVKSFSFDSFEIIPLIDNNIINSSYIYYVCDGRDIWCSSMNAKEKIKKVDDSLLWNWDYTYYVCDGRDIWCSSMNAKEKIKINKNSVFVESLSNTPSISNTPSNHNFCLQIDWANLIADDGKFLWILSSNKFDSRSISNKYWTYWSHYQLNSIWNKYWTYWSEYNSLSPWNKYSNKWPFIIKWWKNYWRLTLNRFSNSNFNTFDVLKCFVSLSDSRYKYFIKYLNLSDSVNMNNYSVSILQKQNCGLNSFLDSNWNCKCKVWYIWKYPNNSKNFDCKKNKDFIDNRNSIDSDLNIIENIKKYISSYNAYIEDKNYNLAIKSIKFAINIAKGLWNNDKKIKLLDNLNKMLWVANILKYSEVSSKYFNDWDYFKAINYNNLIQDLIAKYSLDDSFIKINIWQFWFIYWRLWDINHSIKYYTKALYYFNKYPSYYKKYIILTKSKINKLKKRIELKNKKKQEYIYLRYIDKDIVDKVKKSIRKKYYKKLESFSKEKKQKIVVKINNLLDQISVSSKYSENKKKLYITILYSLKLLLE